MSEPTTKDMKTPQAISLSADPAQARKEVWLQAWVTVAACWNCNQASVAAAWADKCLDAFDKKFGAGA